MAQARRTGQKNTKTKAKRVKTRSSQQWGLLFIVLVSGIAIGAVVIGYGPFGKGLQNYRQQAEKSEQDNRATGTVTNTQQVTATQRTEKDFSFYNVLEDDIGRVLPEDFDSSTVERDKKKFNYKMQLASFKSNEGAQEMRARLALKGIEAKVENKDGNYRLVMGPYKSRRKLKNARNTVKAAGLGLQPIAIQYRIKTD